MTAVELIGLELKRLRKALEGALTGLTATIAWGVWHVVRTEDTVVRFVLQNRRAPVWTEGA